MRESGVEPIEAHAAAVCIAWADDGTLEVLALRRGPHRALYPSAWEGPGGAVKPGESFDQAALRKVEEETGIQGTVRGIVGTYAIPPVANPDGKLIPGVRFIVEVPRARPDLSSGQHSGYRWLRPDQVRAVEWIPTVVEEVESAIKTVTSQP
jgi:8-oxo-dGTP pyrophosphatase MutT (NUDIX family)